MEAHELLDNEKEEVRAMHNHDASSTVAKFDNPLALNDEDSR